MQKVLFVDLDDTLFHSDRKHAPTERCVPLAFLKDGQPISYANVAQQAMLRMVQQQMDVIPVTARNLDAFSRVKIDFTCGAVLNYGGTVLDASGQIDARWLDRSRAASAGTLPMMESLQRDVLRHCDTASLNLSVRMISDHGVPFYIVIKSPVNDLSATQAIAAHCESLCAGLPGVRVHSNGNNVALLPPWLDKRHAVAWVKESLRQRHPEMVSFGMGDSLVDLGFMNECDYLIVPNRSQIADRRLSA